MRAMFFRWIQCGQCETRAGGSLVWHNTGFCTKHSWASHCEVMICRLPVHRTVPPKLPFEPAVDYAYAPWEAIHSVSSVWSHTALAAPRRSCKRCWSMKKPSHWAKTQPIILVDEDSWGQCLGIQVPTRSSQESAKENVWPIPYTRPIFVYIPKEVLKFVASTRDQILGSSAKEGCGRGYRMILILVADSWGRECCCR